MLKSTASKITMNSFYMFAARIIEGISGVVLLSLATRYLGVELFGEYAFIRVVAFVVAPVIAWGMLRILTRDMSVEVDKSPDLLMSGLVINSLISIVFMPVLVIITMKLDSTIAPIALCLALLSQFFIALRQTIGCVFVAHERIIYVSLIIFISRCISVLCFLIAIHYDLGIYGLLSALFVGDAAGLVCAFFVSLKFLRYKFTFNSDRLIYLFKESAPVAISTILNQGYTYIGVFLLKIFRDVSEVSLFQAPQRVIAPLLLLPSSVLVAFVPTISRLASNVDFKVSLQIFYHRIFKYILIITLPVSVFGTICAPQVVGLLFGDEFAQAATAFRILIWTIIPLFENVFLGFILTSIKQQKILVISAIACFISNGILSFALVTEYGYVGVGFASLFSYLVLFMTNFYYLSKHVNPIPIHRIALRPILACIGMCLLLFILRDRMHMFLLAIVAFLLYSCLLFFFKTFSRDEIKIFRDIISRDEKNVEINLPDKSF